MISGSLFHIRFFVLLLRLFNLRFAFSLISTGGYLLSQINEKKRKSKNKRKRTKKPNGRSQPAISSSLFTLGFKRQGIMNMKKAASAGLIS
jgi:hypothetical protein